MPSFDDLLKLLNVLGLAGAAVFGLIRYWFSIKARQLAAEKEMQLKQFGFEEKTGLWGLSEFSKIREGMEKRIIEIERSRALIEARMAEQIEQLHEELNQQKRDCDVQIKGLRQDNRKQEEENRKLWEENVRVNAQCEQFARDLNQLKKQLHGGG